jgi:hypothetical protein
MSDGHDTVQAHFFRRTEKERPVQKLIATIFVVCAGVMISSAAFAQNEAQGGDANKGTGKVKVYDFDGDTIDGDLIRPEGSTVDARDFGNHASLIRIRKDFIPEIIKSAEDL